MLRLHDSAAAERAYFDRLVESEGDFNPFDDRGWGVLQQAFEAWIAPRPTMRLLDVGAGTGQSRRLYCQTVGEYVGIDLSPVAVAKAQRRFPESSWHVADACRLDFDDESFDVVAFSSVLHHIPDFGRALTEAFRVLRPGGQVFAFDPNLLNPAMALLRWPKSPLYSTNGVSPNESPLPPSQLRREFDAAGFVEVRQRCRSGIRYRAVAPKLANALLGAFHVADAAWDILGLGRWFGTFVLTAAMKPADAGGEGRATVPLPSKVDRPTRRAA
jgi:SAM-dependent methyltransferase